MAFHWIESNEKVHSLVNDKKLKPIDCLDHNQEGATLANIPKFLIDLVEQCSRFDDETRTSFDIVSQELEISLQPKEVSRVQPSAPRAMISLPGMCTHSKVHSDFFFFFFFSLQSSSVFAPL
jgi:hypothetical protein